MNREFLIDFHIVCASQLPFAEGTFDAVVLVNALHHIPCGLMIKALQEGIRVLGLGGYLIVIEPLPKGSFFEAFRAIEGETVVRLRRKRQSVSLPGLNTWRRGRSNMSGANRSATSMHLSIE